MIKQLFDHYSFHARLQPAFLALVPLAIGVFAWAQPGAKWPTAIWSLLVSAGFTFFLANVARNLGKSIEAELWKSWGGRPTTQLLRRSGPANPVLRERWHKQLASLVHMSLPTEKDEQFDMALADEKYEAATRLLIGKTRDTKEFPFIYRDNVNYGFCRNLYALRKLGVKVALVGFVASVGAGIWSLKLGITNYVPWGCSAVCGVLLLWWLFTITSEWVKVPAMNYAQHLFEGMEKLVPVKSGGKKASVRE